MKNSIVLAKLFTNAESAIAAQGCIEMYNHFDEDDFQGNVLHKLFKVLSS